MKPLPSFLFTSPIGRYSGGLFGLLILVSFTALRPIQADNTAAGLHSSRVTFQSLLADMMNPDQLALWPDPPFDTHQASSYNRKSKTPADPVGWFTNYDYSQFVRMEPNEGRQEWVMMDADGPGCVDRFWTGGKAATGIVRIYLDGNPQPVIEATLENLLQGKDLFSPLLAYSTPRDAGNFYLPIPYAKHCKISYEEADPQHPSGPPPHRWYNIEYRTYAASTVVQTFVKDDYAKGIDLVNKAGQFLSGPWATPAGFSSTLDREVGPGQEVVLPLPPGAHAVRRLNFKLSGFTPDQVVAAHRATVLQASFDGERTVWCPVSDFFGSGLGINRLTNWACQVTQDGRMSSQWVMPYRQSASFTFHNFGTQKVTVHLEAVVDTWNWTDRSMHFHATWRDQTDIPTMPRSDWNYLTAQGRGVYVGDTLSVYNSSTKWFGEGDEKIFVDGESFPSHFGTGTEDYYGSAWSFPKLFQSSFSNLILRPAHGYIGEFVVTRVRGLDALTFTKSLKLDMEIWHWGDCKVDYTVANYWYASPGATCTTQPQPDAVVRPIK